MKTRISIDSHLGICLASIEGLRELMTKEEHTELNSRMIEALRAYRFADSADQIIAEKMFTLGYLVAHMDRYEYESVPK